MVITEIRRQKRSAGRFSVYLDGEYAFSLSDLDLSLSSLRVGTTITTELVEEYKGLASANAAHSAALRFLSIRMRSKREMMDYLRRKGYEDDQISPALERLEKAGLISDSAFSASWVASRQAVKPRSKRRLEQELMAKGVSRDDIAGAVGEIDSEAEIVMLMEVAERKRKLSQYSEPKKLIAYLARQGYSYDVIKKALSRLDEN